MKWLLITSTSFLLASAPFAQEKPFDAEEAIVAIQKQRQEMTDLIKPLRSKSDAAKALPKLAHLGDQIIETEKRLGAYEASLTGRDKRDYVLAMSKKHKAKHEETNADLSRAIIRLELDHAETYRVLKDNAFIRRQRDDILEVVRSTLDALDKTVQVYTESDGKPPRSLRLAVVAPYSTINEDSLKDPWGKPYQYDRDGKNNNGRKPDIWTIDPADGKTVYGNWNKR